MKKYLLDTHVILWWLDDHPNLSAAARLALADGDNTLFASSVSGYEIAWKARQGKLAVPFQTPSDFTREWQQEQWLELPPRPPRTTAFSFECIVRDEIVRQCGFHA